MAFKHVHRKIERTPEDKARLKAIRDKFQREKPTLSQLVASGDYTEPVPTAQYLELKQMIHRLRKLREEAGLSLTAVAERSGIDKSSLSRLENGHQPNPTLDTIVRYAGALGKRVLCSLEDAR
jgi:DNA-binding XRE family transcriptional regulator